jgi:hypothetical protein
MCAEPNLSQYLEPSDAFGYSATWFECGLSAFQIKAIFLVFLKGVLGFSTIPAVKVVIVPKLRSGALTFT